MSAIIQSDQHARSHSACVVSSRGYCTPTNDENFASIAMRVLTDVERALHPHLDKRRKNKVY